MKVFNINKYVENEVKQRGVAKNEIYKYINEHSWLLECDGLTEEEMNKIGYITVPEWMVEKEDFDNNKENQVSEEIKTDSQQGCLCQECGKRYKIDIMIPDELWEKIKPNGKAGGAGLLCGSCIMKKLEEFNQFDYWFLTKNKIEG